jgi:hypothetical protein
MEVRVGLVTTNVYLLIHKQVVFQPGAAVGRCLGTASYCRSSYPLRHPAETCLHSCVTRSMCV